MDTQTFETHPKTGRPIQPVPAFEVGQPATISILGDSYPAVVTHVSASGKTVYAAQVGSIHTENNVVGYGWEDTETILDPEDVENALKDGKDGAQKFVYRVYPLPCRGNGHDDKKYDGTFHRAYFHTPGGGFRLSPGARSKRDPHV